MIDTHFDDNDSEAGISTVGVLVGLLIVVTLGLGGLSIYSYSNYRDQKDNTDAKINTAVVAAKKTQSTTDEADFAEREKQPTRVFSGPSDFGSVRFSYPKTWSVYIGNGVDGDSGTYTAYFNKDQVPTVTNDQQFAIRLTIQSRDYESVLASYSGAVKKGTLRSSVVTTNGLSGTRIDGQFSKTLDGSVVIFKVRDKTLLVQTDSPSFKGDFDSIVLSSLTFTP